MVRERGFTLVELMTVCSAATVLAALALPSFQAALTKSRRGDAVTALSVLQAAQERFHAGQGMYAPDLATLALATRSEHDFYDLTLQPDGPDSYRATATAVPSGAQAGDLACPQLELQVRSGFATLGPDRRCWNR